MWLIAALVLTLVILLFMRYQHRELLRAVRLIQGHLQQMQVRLQERPAPSVPLATDDAERSVPSPVREIIRDPAFRSEIQSHGRKLLRQRLAEKAANGQR